MSILIGIDASRANKIKKTGTEWYSYHLIQELKKIDKNKYTKNIPEKVAVVYNSHDSERYKIISDKSAVEKVLEKYKINSPYLLYIGRLEGKKNTPGLVQAFSILKNKHESLRDLKLVLVGSRGFGYEKVEKEMLNFSNSKRTSLIRHPELVEGSHNLNIAGGEISRQARNDSGEIILPGWVDEEDLPYLLSGAELFVFPSFYEGFGIPILEAMASGTLVLASDIPALREIGGEAVNFFNPNSPEEMAERIYNILSDDKLKNDLLERGLAPAQKFSWEKCARETMERLKSL